MAINDLPHPGRFAHYVSKLEPYVESPALITDTADSFLGVLYGTPAPLVDGYTTGRHASLQVFGLVNVYPEWNIPYSGPLGNAGDFKEPGTWHWWDECGGFNNHIE